MHTVSHPFQYNKNEGGQTEEILSQGGCGKGDEGG